MTDLLTRQETATLLRVPASRLSKGWGPPRLPGYRRPVYYSKAIVERWLEQQRAEAWESIDGARSGGTVSKSAARPTADQLEREIAGRLRQLNAQRESERKKPLLLPVPDDL